MIKIFYIENLISCELFKHCQKQSFNTYTSCHGLQTTKIMICILPNTVVIAPLGGRMILALQNEARLNQRMN
jgi:hypothetical protein